MNVSPSDAVEMDAETAEGAADAAADHAAAEGAGGDVGAEDMGGSSTSIKDALLHTEPHITPSAAKRDLGVDDAGAHAFIGARKFVAGLGVGGDGDDGTPAVVHFGAAAWHKFTGGDGSDDDAGDEDSSDEAGEGDLEVVNEDSPGYVDPAADAAGGGA